MASVTIVCEQAIFTSARGPTGEGYRIVAASKGLRADEKQKITRSSPSHESLCNPGDEGQLPAGAAFYPLPGGRFCIASSHHAGAEHSGRGGQRVFTHNLIVSAEDFEACGFNPFHIIRALPPSEIDLQKLTPNTILPTLELVLRHTPGIRITTECIALLPHNARLSAVHLLLEEKPIVVDLPKDWVTWAEALLLSIPAPQRVKIAFAAGLRFSASRGHTLNILRDDKHAVQGRVASQGISYVGAKSAPSVVQSQWLSFVDRHWTSGDLAGLASRTSRHFEDCSHTARERVGEMFNAIDTLPQIDSSAVLDLILRSFNETQTGAEDDIRRELRQTAQRQLLNRFASAAWSQISPIWSQLVEFWRNGGEAAVFAQPILNSCLNAAMRSDPIMAAELALTVAQVPTSASRETHETMIKHVVGKLTTMDANSPSDDAERFVKIVNRWSVIRPHCPVVMQLYDRVTASHAAP